MSMREAGAGTNHYSLAHMREKRLRNLENDQGKGSRDDNKYLPESFNLDNDTLRIKDGKKDDRNAWEMDYKDLRSGNFEGSPQQTSASNENDPSPTDPALAPNSLQQNAQQFIERNKQTDTPDYNTSSQDFLKSYTQDFDARNSAEGEKSASNLNFDLPNNVETTDNNDFASGTFDPVNKADEAAQNFLANKKNLILNNFR